METDSIWQGVFCQFFVSHCFFCNCSDLQISYQLKFTHIDIALLVQNIKSLNGIIIIMKMYIVQKYTEKMKNKK